MRLPPGVSSKDFSAAMQHLEKVVGKDWVFTSDDDVALYRDAYTPAWHEEEEKIPSAAVAPANVEEVQAVVKIANQYKIPLWPVSTGKNLAYGGTSPALSGTRHSGFEAHGSGSGGERKESLRARRARRQLLRSLPLHSGAQAQGVDRSCPIPAGAA